MFEYILFSELKYTLSVSGNLIKHLGSISRLEHIQVYTIFSHNLISIEDILILINITTYLDELIHLLLVSVSNYYFSSSYEWIIEL